MKGWSLDGDVLQALLSRCIAFQAQSFGRLGGSEVGRHDRARLANDGPCQQRIDNGFVVLTMHLAETLFRAICPALAFAVEETFFLEFQRLYFSSF
jgi:hypothetical protein